MAKPGPSPVPTKILQLRGSTVLKRKGTARPNEPSPPAEKPQCPASLSPKARAMWRRIIAQLHTMGLLAQVDGPMLARYCELWVEWKAARTYLLEHGQTVTTYTEAGDVSKVELYPQARFLMALSTELRRIEQHFGMSPSARASLGQVSQEKKADVTTGKDPERFFRRA